MIEPDGATRRAVVESECHNVNPVAAQVGSARVPGPKRKIECNRYGEEDDKGRQDSESSSCVKSAEVLADRQRLHLQKAIGNEITGEREEYPQANPTKQNIGRPTNVVIGENQNHAYATQAIERRQMSLAGVHRILLKRTAPPALALVSINSQILSYGTMTIRTDWRKRFHR